MQGADLCGWIGIEAYPLEATASALDGIVAAVVAAWLLFPAMALGTLAGFAEAIVAAVERRHYPEHLAATRRLGVTGTALLGLRSSGRLLLVNLVALPFYLLLLLLLLLLLVTGIGPIVLFVLVLTVRNISSTAVSIMLAPLFELAHRSPTYRRACIDRPAGLVHLNERAESHEGQESHEGYESHDRPDFRGLAGVVSGACSG